MPSNLKPAQSPREVANIIANMGAVGVGGHWLLGKVHTRDKLA